jgi:hypothetical protein
LGHPPGPHLQCGCFFARGHTKSHCTHPRVPSSAAWALPTTRERPRPRQPRLPPSGRACTTPPRTPRLLFQPATGTSAPRPRAPSSLAGRSFLLPISHLQHRQNEKKRKRERGRKSY